MDEIIDLHGHRLSLDNEEGRAFVCDCARYSEGILAEEAVRKRYRFDESTWTKLGSDEKLIEAIEAEKVKRIRDGSAARERAQNIFATAPNILGNILHDDSASPRHRIEASKELRQIADNCPETAPSEAGRFIITINLGNDEVLHFDKPIAIEPDDTNPNNTDTTPQGLLPIIAAKKRDGDDGEPI
jgi:hypothetical protein